MVKDKKWISLNVGGSYFLTSRQTLTRHTAINSPLHRISTNSTNVHFDRDDRGAYLIDRDPAYFQVVLNFLRHGHLLMTRDVSEEGILIESEYFNIPDLSRLIKQRLNNRTMMNTFLMNSTSSSSTSPQEFLHHFSTTNGNNNNNNNHNHNNNHSNINHNNNVNYANHHGHMNLGNGGAGLGLGTIGHSFGTIGGLLEV